MTDLSPTPLTPRCKECGTALELPGVAAELERLERSLAERDAQLQAASAALCDEAAWKQEVKDSRTKIAALEARNAALVKALSDLITNGQLEVHRGHFDWTGEHGRGCEVCIKQRAARKAAEAALEAQQGGES